MSCLSPTVEWGQQEAKCESIYKAGPNLSGVIVNQGQPSLINPRGECWPVGSSVIIERKINFVWLYCRSLSWFWKKRSCQNTENIAVWCVMLTLSNTVENNIGNVSVGVGPLKNRRWREGKARVWWITLCRFLGNTRHQNAQCGSDSVTLRIIFCWKRGSCHPYEHYFDTERRPNHFCVPCTVYWEWHSLMPLPSFNGAVLTARGRTFSVMIW